MTYRTDTTALILAILDEGPQHGYGVSRAVREKSAQVLKLGEGQLYPILHELERNELIAGEWQTQEGDPPKRVYRITPEGRAELLIRARKWNRFAGAVGSVLELSKIQNLEAGHE